MKLFPKEEIRLTIHLSKEEVTKKLSENITYYQLFKKKFKLFYGELKGDHFVIYRNQVDHYTSFSPKIEGEIKPYESGSFLNLNFSLKEETKVMLFMINGFGLFFNLVIVLISVFTHQFTLLFILFSYLLLILFSIVMTYFSFDNEVTLAIEDLNEVLN